jgi:hypothetical protein
MPTPRTWIAAELISASTMNSAVRDVLNYLLVPPTQAEVTAAETRASTSYGALATAGPTISGITLEAGQPVLVIVSARIFPSTAALEGFMSFAVSGAETDAANDDDAARMLKEGESIVTRPSIYVAGTAGSHTFTSQYRCSSATTVTFRDRRLIVMPR